MKLRGGYDVLLTGRPAGEVESVPEPDRLLLPLRSRRLHFSRLEVSDGQRVQMGRVLAVDPDNYGVPLPAPRAGTVRLTAAEGHVVLEDLAAPDTARRGRAAEPHAPSHEEPLSAERQRLLALGAWQFLSEAHTGAVPDPSGAPQAVIVSTLSLEPFGLRGDLQLRDDLAGFTRGLEHVQSLLEYQPTYLVLPDVRSELARQVQETVRGYAWVHPVQVPLRYPFDDFRILARYLRLGREAGPVWALRAEGVLAIDRALTLGLPCAERLVALGGPAVREPKHLKVMPGYPLAQLLEGRLTGEARVICGGALTGRALDHTRLGLSAECTALTAIPHQADRELLGFARPGWDRRSYSRCFVSLLRPGRGERLTTLQRGERRACVTCGLCEEVCPVGILPHRIHKHLYQDNLEEAEDARLDLCIACGLCAYVCPSKIDLRRQFLDAQERIRQELHAPEAAG